MTFLSPALLALAAAAAVPVLLHLLHRHQAPRLVFPAVRYLRRAEREYATRIRLRQLFLLALRVLGILFLAIAAARPFLRGAGDGHAPTAVAVVLDNSMSGSAVVDGRRVLDRLNAAALATLDRAGHDDRFWLIRAGAPWEPAATGAAAETRRAIEATTPAAGASDLHVQILRAAAILDGAAHTTREIHVLSDLQATGLGALADSVPYPVRVLAPATAPPMNRAVTATAVGGGLPPRAGEPTRVTATIAGPPGDSVAVRLAVDGAVRATTRAPTGATAVLPAPALPAGPVSGYVEIDRDDLAADDRRWFAIDVAPPPTVAAIDPGPFLRDALEVLADAGRVRTAGPDRADVVIATGARGASALRRGARVVLLPPSSPLEIPAANRRLADAGVPWRLEARPGEARIDTAGLALAAVLADTRLRQAYGLTAVPAGADTGRDSVRVRLRSGEPWAVAGTLAARDEGTPARYVLLATPWTLEASTLPTSAALVPLLDRVVNVWAAAAVPVTAHHPGDVVRPAGDSVARPDGTSAALGDAGLRLTDAGVYRVLDQGRVTAALAVNPPARESDLARLTPEEAADRIGGDVQVAAAEDWPDVIYHRRLGRDLTVPAVILALAMLLLESAVAAAGRA